ncbi:hypothetical protein [Methylobacterium sp. JK268]
MITAEQALERARSPLAALVAARAQAVGSRMEAYRLVGAPLGRSATWVRKVLGRAPDVQVGLHDALNIASLYDRLCARIEAAADAVEADNQRLREELDAALSRPVPARGRVAGEPAAAAGASASSGAARRATACPVVVPAVGARADALGLTDLPLFRGTDLPPR